MKFASPRLRQLLAAEYALGTLAGAARRRFQRQLRADPALAGEVSLWDQRFAALGARLPPVAPREIVWISLQHRIAGSAPQVIEARPNVPLNLWRAAALIATAATVVLGIRLNQEMARPLPPQQVVERPVVLAAYVGLLQDAKSGARWAVSLTPERRSLSIVAAGKYPLTKAQDLELWWITDKGPVSLGLLPRSGSVSHPLPAGLPVAAGGTIAISLEPLGGSPTGAPTGPVVTTAPVVQAS